MAKKVTIHITDEPNVAVEAIGFNGSGCTKAVDELLAKADIAKIGEPEKKPEFFAGDAIGNTVAE